MNKRSKNLVIPWLFPGCSLAVFWARLHGPDSFSAAVKT